jgi:D-alanyl-D-alanine carboxypeptidase (penicillin-binding protein 5/6)
MSQSPSSRNRSRGAFLFFSLFFLLLWAAAPCGAKTRAESFVLKTSHKHAPSAREKKAPEQAAEVAADPAPAAVNAGAADAAETAAAPAAPKPKKQASAQANVTAPVLRKKLSSRSAIVMDSRTGQVLYSHDADRPGQPASTIKVITGLIAIGSLRDDEMVQASRHAAAMPSSKVNLRPGKSYLADDLINAVLLASANDASVALAEKVAGSEGSFARLMTSKAKSLGATSTLCKTASGLTAEGQQSTARDLAVVFDKAMEDREFAERIGRTTARTRFGQVLRNHNKALWRVDGAVGGKTGYTLAARQTYVGKFSRNNEELVVAIMGSETMWADLSKLVEYGFARKEQLAALESADPTPAAANDGPLAATAVSPAFKNEGLKVLSDNKKPSSL